MDNMEKNAKMTSLVAAPSVNEPDNGVHPETTTIQDQEVIFLVK